MDVGGFNQLNAVGAIMGVDEEYAVAADATYSSSSSTGQMDCAQPLVWGEEEMGMHDDVLYE